MGTMELSVRNSARQTGHQVAKYIMKTGFPLPTMLADSTFVPSTRVMVNAGGV